MTEKQTQSGTDRPTRMDRETDTQAQTDLHALTEKQTHSLTDRPTRTDRETDTLTHRQTYTQ